ncbi:mechanosensitive ion channel family protein [Phosphitispora fastidiosa]|uniref:mechanosensitive ion channel family protein n=1 Tax=Phosphitispora fastidiosa TaxID=2837202 RepID=UPI001E37378B|nr:mechanosensitive ion channel family protein [Phosphitispora fastidiosa]MBU7007098.1 MscS family membrane protein [Phosphitispora fastidiosa]
MLEKLDFLKTINYWFLNKLTPGLTVDLLTAIAILTFFMVFKNTLSGFIIRIFTRVSGKTKTAFDDHIIISFQKPLRWLLVLLGFYLALAYLPLGPGFDLMLLKIFRSGLIILAASGFYSLAGSYDLLQDDLEKIFGREIDKILMPFLSKVFKVIIVALALTIVAQEWDYDINSFIAGLGLGGLAFALAAKDTVSNIFGGIVIITDKPFSMGDWVHTPSVEGIVEDINFRSTRIRTFAQALVTVPNATLVNEPITNWTRMGIRRITFNLGVTYSTPREKLQKCVQNIRSMLESHPEINKDFILVRFDSFNESSLDIFLYFFTNTTNWAEYLKVKEDINFRIMEILESEGVSVAFPSTSIYFETPLEGAQ